MLVHPLEIRGNVEDHHYVINLNTMEMYDTLEECQWQRTMEMSDNAKREEYKGG